MHLLSVSLTTASVRTRTLASATASPHHSLLGLAPFITSQPRASCSYNIPTPAVALLSGSTIILNSWYLNLSKNNNFKFLGLTVFLLDFYFLTIIILIITCKRTTCRGCFLPSSVSKAIQLCRLNYTAFVRKLSTIIECMNIREWFQVILNVTHFARFKQIRWNLRTLVVFTHSFIQIGKHKFHEEKTTLKTLLENS